MELLLVLRASDAGGRQLGEALSAVAPRRMTAHTAGEAESVVAGRRPDAVVFDPTVADLAALSELRSRHSPTLALVAWLGVRSSGSSALLLTGGADEVLDVSMSGDELRARLLKAVRQRGPADTVPVVFADLEIDARAGQATWRGSALPLTPRECEVLHVLAAAQGRVVRRELLYRQVWGWTMPRGDRTVDVNVKRLRDKLAAAGAAIHVATQPGVGYRLLESPDGFVTGP